MQKVGDNAMKKIISIILTFIFLFTFASAQELYTEYANTLNDIGLFKGTENGYELDKTFTRSEGATMIVRLLGKEDEALSAINPSTVFEDVKQHWSLPYVSYCYNNGITKGTSKTEFSPEVQMTGEEYVTLILRSLGYSNVNPENADIAAAEFSLASSVTLKELFSGDFTRNKMVYVSYMALNVMDAEGTRLIDKLADSGVVKQRAASNVKFPELELDFK